MPPSEKLTNLADRMGELTVLEAGELAKMLEEKWGVSASSIASIIAPQIGPTPAAPVAEVQTEFSVILTGFGTAKIPVMKEIRPIAGLDLKGAQEFMANLPHTLKEGVSRDEAETIKAKIEGVGGTVTIQ